MSVLEIIKDDLRFEWHGGAYIEIFSIGNPIPFDVINVWDYEKDETRIDIQGFFDVVHEWLNERENA